VDLVVDANVLFAALVKQSKTAELLFRDELHLYAPDFIFEEYSKYKGELLEKTGRSPQDFEHLVKVLQRRINVLPVEEFLPFMKEAKAVSPDAKDAAYFAVALKLGASIWSNDKKLKEQKQVKVWNTSELASKL